MVERIRRCETACRSSSAPSCLEAPPPAVARLENRRHSLAAVPDHVATQRNARRGRARPRKAAAERCTTTSTATAALSAPAGSPPPRPRAELPRAPGWSRDRDPSRPPGADAAVTDPAVVRSAQAHPNWALRLDDDNKAQGLQVPACCRGFSTTGHGGARRGRTRCPEALADCAGGTVFAVTYGVYESGHGDARAGCARLLFTGLAKRGRQSGGR